MRPLILFCALIICDLLTESLLANTDHLAALRLQSRYAPDDGVANGDLFGSAVAMDGMWAVVGAPGDDSARFVDEGSAYVLRRESGTWKIHQKLYVHGNSEAYLPRTPIHFGQAVAISRDWIAVGAPNYRNSDDSLGRVRLYRLSGTTWTLSQTLSPSLTTSSRRFGSSLALSEGQILAVGTPTVPDSSLAGQVFTYRLESNTSVWTSHLQMTGPAVANTEFGRSLAFGGPSVYVGLPGYAAPGTPNSRGEVHVFSLASTGPNAPLTHKLLNPAPTEIDRFGAALVVRQEQLLIGVRGLIPTKQVIACLYRQNALETKILAPENFPPIYADCPVALGSNFALVGCPRVVGNSTEFVLQSFNLGLPLPPELVAHAASLDFRPLPTGSASDFRQILATSESLSLVGAPGFLANGLAIGGVLPMVETGQSGLVLSPTISHLQSNDGFGERLEADGDTLLASATRWGRSPTVGTVHVYTRKDGIWEHSHSLDNPSRSSSGARVYGEVMSVKGRWMAISSPQAGGHKILVYGFRDGKWSQTPAVISLLDGRAMEEIMGLDISGDSLVVVTRATGQGWLAGRFRLADSGPVYVSKASAEKAEHTAPEISLSGDRAALRLFAGSRSISPVIYDTSKNPWKKLATMPLRTGFNPMLSRYSRGLIWAGKGLLLSGSGINPVAFMPSGAAWSSSQPFGEGFSPFSLDAEDDLALLTSRDNLKLYSQRSGKWLFAKHLRPEDPYSGNYLAISLTQDSVIYGKTNYPNPSYSRLFIYLHAAMEVYDGPTTSGQLMGRGFTLNLGEVASGAATPLPLTLKNTGDTTWTFAGLDAAPPIVTLPTSFVGKPVPPGGLFTLPAFFAPTGLGQQTVTLRLRATGSSMPLATVNLSFNAQSSLPLPSDMTTGLSKLVRLGDPFTLSLSPTTSRSLACRWFKDGRLLPEDTTTFFFRSKATIADAGTYSVEVTAPDGAKQLIKNILLGVYPSQGQPLRVALGGTLAARARVWGPGVRYRWNTRMDDGSIRGSRTSSLQIRNFHPSRVSENTLYAFASMGDTTAIVGTWPLQILPFTELLPSGPAELTLGEDTLLAGVTHAGDVQNLRFTATGLPPGVVLDPTSGVLSGTPTRAGIYNIIYRASFTGGAAKPATDRIIVYDPLARRVRPGTLFGVISTGNPGAAEVSPYLEQLGPSSMQVEIALGGRATAHWQIGGRRLSAVGQFDQLVSNNVCQLIFPASTLGLGSLDCVITIFTQSQQITCEVRAEQPDGRLFSWQGSLQYRAIPVTNNIRNFAGRRTTFFSSAKDDVLLPRGSGYGSLTITQALNVQCVGTLPDGSGITFASMVLDHGAGIPFCANLAPGTSFVGSYSQELTEGNAFWRRPPSLGNRFYPAGFQDAEYKLSAFAYSPPVSGGLLLPQMEPTDGRMKLSLTSSALTSELMISGKLTTAHIAVFDAPNFNEAKIDFYVPTGFFTGSAVVDDPLPGSTTRRVKRTLNFSGMLTSERGEGFFLLPMLPDATAEPPTTSANSPILSGSLLLQPTTTE